MKTYLILVAWLVGVVLIGAIMWGMFMMCFSGPVKGEEEDQQPRGKSKGSR